MANIEKLMSNVETRMVKEAEQKEKKNRKVYHFKKFSTPYIVFYPLMVLCWYYDELINWIRSYCKWDEKRVQRIITEEIIHRGELEPTTGTIYYEWRKWGNWWFSKYHCHLKDRKFCRKFNEQITEYFVNEYQLKGYSKEVDNSDNEWYSFTFARLEEQ